MLSDVCFEIQVWNRDRWWLCVALTTGAELCTVCILNATLQL